MNVHQPPLYALNLCNIFTVIGDGSFATMLSAKGEVEDRIVGLEMGAPYLSFCSTITA